MRHPQKSMMREYLLAGAATLVALLARAALDPLLGDHLPYVTFFIAVAVTTSYAGPGASLTAVLMGGLAAEWFFMPPRQAVTVVGVSQQLGLVLYFLVTLVIVGFGQVLRRAKQLADRAMDGLRQEVAERTRVEASLRDTQSALARAQRAAQAGLWEVDLRSGRLMWSDADYDLFGLDRDVEPSVETWLSCIHPDDRSHAQGEYNQSIEEGRDQNLEFRIVRPDGNVRWLHRKGQIVRDEQGVPVRVSGITLDITDRKEAELALQRSEALYRAIGESIDYGVWVCAPDGHTTHVSDSFLKLLGISREQCFNFGWKDMLHPDDAREIMSAWEECVRTGGTWDRENRFRGADGQWHHILSRGVPVKDEQGHIVSWAGIHLDIGGLKRSEEALHESEARFRTLADNISQLAWMADGTGSLSWYNRRWYEYTGTTFDEMQGWGWTHVHHPQHVERVLVTWKKAHATGEAWEDTFPLRGRDGQYRWFLSRAMPIRDAAGQVVRWFGTNTDITDLREAQASLMHSEERLRMLTSQLEQLVEERTEELVQSQAELRALATELNLTEQRERKRVAVELHDHLAQMLVLSKLKLSQMKQVAPGCLGLIKETDDVLAQCLTYTRTLVANLAPPVLHDFGLPAALRWLGEQLSQQGLPVEVHLGRDDLPLPEDQAVLLFQSVRELLMNVVKHAGADQAVVTLDETDGELRIQVSDDGTGFDPSAAGHAANAMSSKFGLFSIRERMRAMGGACEIESEQGKGTAATLRVPLTAPGAGQGTRDRDDHPLDAASRERAPAGSTGKASSVSQAVARSSISVLLVDDHAMVREGLRSVLESHPDIEVVGEAWDGEEAVSSVERLRPTITVMDINMPRMNGIEATAVIKARYPATIIIGLSVNAEGENQRAMLEAGAAMLLTKEAAVEELQAAILKLLDRK